VHSTPNSRVNPHRSQVLRSVHLQRLVTVAQFAALRVKLHARQTQRGLGILGPDELTLVQPPSGQPHANAIVHEHFHPVGPPIGEQVSVVRAG
jgi:hypothetical protein